MCVAGVQNGNSKWIGLVLGSIPQHTWQVRMDILDKNGKSSERIGLAAGAVEQSQVLNRFILNWHFWQLPRTSIIYSISAARWAQKSWQYLMFRQWQVIGENRTCHGCCRTEPSTKPIHFKWTFLTTATHIYNLQHLSCQMNPKKLTIFNA